MTKKHVSLLVVFVLLFTTLFSSFAFAADEVEWEIADDITINVKAHIQTHGDKDFTDDGEIFFGTSGEAKRLEKFDITLGGKAPENMQLVAYAHIQTHGYKPGKGVFGAGPIGTDGEKKRIEGVAFKLIDKTTGKDYPGYRVGYQVHMQSFGWGISATKNEKLGTEAAAYDGEFAGTEGLKKRIEGVSLQIERIAKLSVVDVTADNLKQVVVEFNQDVVGNEEVEDVDNYSLKNSKDKAVDGKGGKVEIKDVEVSGNTAVVTFTNAVENQTKATFVINKAVVGEEIKEELYFNDLKVPVVDEAEVIGENTIKVVFSEPVDASTATINQFAVKSEDGKTDYRVKSILLEKNDTEALVEVRKDFEDGDEVVLTVSNGIKDYAGFRVATTSIDLIVVEDNSEIEVVDFRQAKEDGIILIFNKNITVKDKDKSNFYHTNSKNTVDKDGATADGNELTLNFTTNELPTGTATIFIDGDSLGDYWGNTNEKTIRFEARISEDKVNPTIKEVKAAADGRNLTVKFDKSMDKKSATDKDNYTILFESSGKEVKDTKIYRATLNSDNKTVDIRLSGDALAAGKYILQVSDDVEDIRGNAVIDGEKKFSLEGVALKKTDIIVTGYQNGISDNKDGTRDVDYTIVVDYQRQMDLEDERYAIDLLENYSILFGDKLTTLATLNDKGNYSVDLDVDDDEEVVEITIEVEDEKASDKIEYITISRVKDANGLLSDQASYTIKVTYPDKDESAIKLDGANSVKATALNKIEIKLNKKIDYFEDEDIQFEIKETSGAAFKAWDSDNIDDIELSDDGKKIIVTLTDDLDYNGKVKGEGTLKLKALTGKSDNKYGDKLVITSDEAISVVVDGIKPVLDEDYNKDPDTLGAFEDGIRVRKGNTTTSFAIDLMFTEDLVKVGNEPLLRGAFKLDDIGSSLTKVSTDGKVLTFTIEGKDYSKLHDTTVNLTNESSELKDAAGNNVSTFSIPVAWNLK